ncbi:MAG: response regulator [Bacteroidales bacterium]|nr:response regulator [Bacteroidales bacterium]
MDLKLIYKNAAPAIRIGLIYFVLSFLWIYFSDQLIFSLSPDPEFLTRIQTYKGWFFITSSAILIYVLIYSEIKRKNKIIKHINESETWYNKMVSSIPDVDVFLFDKDLQIILAQGQGLTDYHLPIGGFGGRKATEAFGGELGVIISPKIQRIINGDTVYTEFAYNNQWFLLSGAPVWDEMKNINAGVMILLDITNRKEKEHQIIEAKEKAEEGNKIKTAFISNLSHEIRTPMNGILGFTDLVTDEDLSIEQRLSYSKIIRNSTHQLKAVIESIIQISRIQTGQVRVNNSMLNLNDFLLQLFKTFKEDDQLQLNNNQFLLNNLLSNETRLFSTDPVLLLEVFANLINNAMKYTNDGKIVMGCKDSPDSIDEVIFFVSDTGIGIEKDKQDQIFHSFRQAEDPHTRKYGGLGLGLNIASGLVNLLGGNITMESEQGKGSTFYFSIKADGKNRLASTVLIPETKKVFDFSDKNILIVEDVKHNSELFRIILKSTNANLIFTNNGQEAIDVCENNNKVDLILMDIRMPAMNGFEATRIIKERFPTVKIIAQTAYAGPKEIQECYDSGCDDFIGKPIHRLRLLKLLDKYLRK